MFYGSRHLDEPRTYLESYMLYIEAKNRRYCRSFKSDYSF